MDNDNFINLMKRIWENAGMPQERRKKEIIIYCRKCDSKMIKRENKFGKGYWYGCSAFPKCKSTMKEKNAKKLINKIYARRTNKFR